MFCVQARTEQTAAMQQISSISAAACAQYEEEAAETRQYYEGIALPELRDSFTVQVQRPTNVVDTERSKLTFNASGYVGVKHSVNRCKRWRGESRAGMQILVAK
eukprot:SAG31_NODE_1042_length_10187_cov_54.452121_16_plen_104_part_00